MTHQEIQSTYTDLSPCEAFQAFEADNVDNATVADVLGDDVANEYCHWIYANIK